jgi:tetrahydromethanopterin S-methyltransferase subunit G
MSMRPTAELIRQEGATSARIPAAEERLKRNPEESELAIPNLLQVLGEAVGRDAGSPWIQTATFALAKISVSSKTLGEMAAS